MNEFFKINYLKSENKKLLAEKTAEDQSKAMVSEDSKRITGFYKDQMNQLTKTIETLRAELAMKSSTEKIQEGVQINAFNTQNFINMSPPSIKPTPSNLTNSSQKKAGPIKVARPRKLSEDGYEMKVLELEGENLDSNSKFMCYSLKHH